ncbi:hypothetical protein E2F46_09785 [Luteimonas aestuarii]|uniref:Uncharacterized protein n=1 Tax=Luteimonas aestuarii TaxID=453837 RepID=A0A4R5TSE0_9GAMM|nr:hypothetical protein [Luteimonas aestuarii]TDK23812.1 hypothetical protein E2F46_09785 [Luteimonas aestuarii]
MPKHQIAFFTFTLGRRESIGPIPLRAMWARASGIADAGVERKVVRGDEERPLYTLYAPQHLPDLPGVEQRLRVLLEAAHLKASLRAVYM